MKRFLMLSVLFAAPALAQKGPFGPDDLDHGHMAMLFKAAALTPDQRAQAHRVLKDCHEQTRPLERQEHDLREQLADKLAGTTPVQLSDLVPLRQKIRDLQVQIDDAKLNVVIKVRALLKPDQLQKLSQAHDRFKALRGEMDRMMEEPEGQPDEGR